LKKKSKERYLGSVLSYTALAKTHVFRHFFGVNYVFEYALPD